MRDKNGCTVNAPNASSTHTITYKYVKQPDGSYKRKYSVTMPYFGYMTE